MTMIITMGLFPTGISRALIIIFGSSGVALGEPAELFINGEIAEVRQHLIEPSDASRASTGLWGISLPSPLGFTKTYANGAWQVDGVGVSPSTDVELRATGQLNSVTNRLEGNLSLRFRF